MNKESYKRLFMDVTRFDIEDIITTSGPACQNDSTQPDFDPGQHELFPGGV